MEPVCEDPPFLGTQGDGGEGLRIACAIHNQLFLSPRELGGLCSICSPRTRVQGAGGMRAASPCLCPLGRCSAPLRRDGTMLEWAEGGCPRVGVLLPPCRTSLPLRQRVLLAVFPLTWSSMAIAVLSDTGFSVYSCSFWYRICGLG